MTPHEIFLVKSSFELVACNAESFAPIFYARLFELDPTLRGLFRGDLVEQGKKLTQMLTVVVRSLDRLETMLPAVRSLGDRHRQYGVTAAHYDTVGAALIWTLRRLLGDAFTGETKVAWITAYATLAEQMVDEAEVRPQQRVA